VLNEAKIKSLVKLELGEGGLGADACCKLNGDVAHVLDDIDHVDGATGSGGCCSNGECNDAHCNALNCVSAAIGGVNAESAAIVFALRALLPADRAVSIISTIARRVAEEPAHLKAWLANQRLTSTTTV